MHNNTENEVLTRATEVFGDVEEAERWLNTPALAMDGQKPVDLLDTREGHRQVLELLIRIDHGVYT